MFGKGMQDLNQRLMEFEKKLISMKEKEEKLKEKVEVYGEMLSESLRENRTLQRQNLEILKKLENFKPTLTNLIYNQIKAESYKFRIWSNASLAKIEDGLQEIKDAKSTAEESKTLALNLVGILTEALEEWRLEPDQKKMQELAEFLEEHGKI